MIHNTRLRVYSDKVLVNPSVGEKPYFMDLTIEEVEKLYETAQSIKSITQKNTIEAGDFILNDGRICFVEHVTETMVEIYGGYFYPIKASKKLFLTPKQKDFLTGIIKGTGK